jgi:hypothetical protein
MRIGEESLFLGDSDVELPNEGKRLDLQKI